MRTTQQQTLQLSQMADQKASILMGASFLVFSIAVSRAFSGHLPVSLAILAMFAFLSSLCAVIAVLPSVSPKGEPQGANRLFFGHFAELSRERYLAEVAQILKPDGSIYATQAADLYSLGVYLARHKYRYLRFSYLFFLMGFVFACGEQALQLVLH